MPFESGTTHAAEAPPVEAAWVQEVAGRLGHPEWEAILRHLNLIYAELVEAASRYLHLQVTTQGLDHLVVGEVLGRGHRRALRQARQVASKIVQFGGYPSLALQLDFGGERTTGAEAIRTALAFEQGALDLYRDLLERARGQLVVEEFARRRIGEQSEQVARLYMLLES